MNTLLAQGAATPPEDSNIRTIPLSQGKFSVVDASDFAWLSQWKWHAAKRGGKWYAERNVRIARGIRRIIGMHQQILNPQSGLLIDHRDGDGLNNTRANIREATSAQNNWNRPKAKGYWLSPSGKWAAKIIINGKRIYLGRFLTEAEARHAYINASQRLKGEFAPIV